MIAGVRNNQTGIYREAFAADQASPDARAYYTLEHAAEDVAVMEPLIAGPRKCRVIRDLVFNHAAPIQLARRSRNHWLASIIRATLAGSSIWGQCPASRT
jgi:hypothetical protein